MCKLKKILKEIILHYDDEELLKADGFDDAVIGVCDDFNQPIRLIYSVTKCIDILQRTMSEEEALEYFTFNVSGAYLGPKTPVWCWDDFE